MQSRAAVLVEPGRLEQWDVPTGDPEPGGLLVRVIYGGVCGSDVHLLHGTAGTLPFPVVLGHEGVGVVEQLGAGVTTDYASQPLDVGDLVYWSPIAACNHCYTCTILEQTPCESAQYFEAADKPGWGGYQEYAWLPAGLAAYRLPDDASAEAVIALGCALPTALRGNEQMGPVQLGETVVVQGAGPVGLSAVLVAKASGAREIIVIDQFANRLEVAKSLGATETLSMRELSADERKQRVWDRTGHIGPNVVVEAAGALPAFPEGVDLAGSHSRYSILGLWGAEGTVPISPRDVTLKNLQIKGATFPKPKHYYGAMMLSARLEREIPLTELISHRFSIGDAPEALRAVEAGETVKAVIDPTLS